MKIKEFVGWALLSSFLLGIFIYFGIMTNSFLWPIFLLLGVSFSMAFILFCFWLIGGEL